MRKCLVFFVIVLAVFWAAPAYVSADVGPKESVVLTFEGEKRRDTFYVTLLSRGRPVLYAVLANLFSFAAGLALAYWVPGIF